MDKVIKRIGDFALRYKTFICTHDYTSHDIEIVKFYKTNKDAYIDPDDADIPDELCYTIADFTSEKDEEDPDVISCGNRLLEAIKESEDVNTLKELVKEAYRILREDPEPREFSSESFSWISWLVDQKSGKLVKNQSENNNEPYSEEEENV